METVLHAVIMAWQHSTALDTRLSFLRIPSGRCGHSMSAWSNSLVLFAGFDGTRWLNDVHILNTESLVWRQPRVTGHCPDVRQYHAAGVVDSRLFVYGGYNGVSWLGDVCVFDLHSFLWKQVRPTGDLPGAKEGHAMTVAAPWLYVFGGWNGAAVSDLHRLHCDSLVWEKLLVLGHTPAVCGHSMSLVNGQLYIFGGFTGSTWNRDMHRIALDQRPLAWEALDTQGAPQARGYHSAVVVSRFILIYAGYNGVHILGDLLAFDTDALTWSFPDPFSERSLDARNAHTMTRFGSELYLFGGYNGFRDTNDLHILESAAFSTLHDDIAKAWASDQWKDVTLIAGDAEQKVHCALLATRCPVLHQQVQHACAYLPPISAATLEAFCDFLYSDGVKTAWALVRNELKTLASLYHVPRLRLLCEDFADTPESSYSSDIMKIRTLHECSDLTIVVESQVFHTHKFILACRCPYFQALLHAPMREQRSAHLHLPGISAAAFTLVLDWIYSDKFSPLFSDAGIDLSLGFQLLRDAGVLLLDCLVRMTEIALLKQLTPANVCQMLDFSFESNAAKLRAGCLNYLLQHFERVDKRDLASLTPDARALLKGHLSKSMQKRVDGVLPEKVALVKLDTLRLSPSPDPLNIKGEKLAHKISPTLHDTRLAASFRANAIAHPTKPFRNTQLLHPRRSDVFVKTGIRLVHRSLSGLI